MADDKKADKKKPNRKRQAGVAAVLFAIVWFLLYPAPKTHDNVIVAQAWVGSSSGQSVHAASEWDPAWQTHFGGVDDPKHRQKNGSWPAGFTPKENPYYVALPYSEFADDWSVRPNAEKVVPWYDPKQPPTRKRSILKNHWVVVKVGVRSVYAQWQDVGPYGDNDADYVFGDKPPASGKAGIAMSPAAMLYLDVRAGDHVSWAFADSDAIPVGPWSSTVTTSQMSR